MSRRVQVSSRGELPFPVERKPLDRALEDFVRRYRTNFDGPEAARWAGYDSPETIWPELLARPEVQARLRSYRAGVDMPDRSREALLDTLFARAFVDLGPLIWIDSVTGMPRYDLRKATPEQLGALEIQETLSGQSQRRTVRIRPRPQTVEMQALLRHYGLQEADQNSGVDRLQQALIEISERGSRAPIATARRNADTVDPIEDLQ